MKILKIALLAGAVLVFTPSFSQKVTKKVTKEICDCFNKIDVKSPNEALKQESDACMMQGIMNNLEGLVKEYKIEEGDEAATEKMGTDIGMRLVKECPAFLTIYVAMEANKEKEEKPEGEEKKEEEKKDNE
jgi:hypothetical protein